MWLYPFPSLFFFQLAYRQRGGLAVCAGRKLKHLKFYLFIYLFIFNFFVTCAFLLL